MPELNAVTYARVKDALASVDVELEDIDFPDVGHARLNNIDTFIAVLDNQSVIVRAEYPLDSLEGPWFAACNHFNARLHGVKAVVATSGDTHGLRTESEFPVSAYMSDAQLQESLEIRIDLVLAGMKALQDLGKK
ncbi:YbjN domain-containing protein [Corynebacterium sp. TAE3-ERU2]|uniref:YbjN domain-containing protein n=1 Tax=Corynebacterium sp. TAE3-ERU2 TaxID=2849497 RepID=UPI001C47921E|nr:YbjN domain-containing protein [Corynebacterium sp. TAE3-ERU2]MBV7302705.1 YbjN domain-containing protein [Corynebacterium sp. TAE3-ERU2]